MYLKSITLKGFKSFAAPTTLRFEPGITCVVGPNGSGKSNVVDALSWVLGEQGPKSLRGGKMEDVIFAGTSARAPLGRADVSVTIDNTDGALPIEYTEVTISRILFRNGQSEYRINGEGVRLLDIQELLSDSGIGREMHVIVGQGQLDAILMANPEERRGFIEEAAGVLKHRKRKEKALRKIESMAGNLTRIQDLTVELRRQLKPLGKQAEVAAKAATIQADVRDSRLRLLADDFITLAAHASLDVADESALRARRSEVESELDRYRNREVDIDRITVVEGPELISAQENYYQLTAHREKLRGTENLASERARFLSEEAEEARALGRDPQALDEEAAVLRNEEAVLNLSLAESRKQLSEASAQLLALEQSLKSEEDRISASLRAVADHREGSARQEGDIKSLQSRIESGNAEIARLTQARLGAQERMALAQAEFIRLEVQIAGLGEGELTLDATFEKHKSTLNGAKANLDSLRTDLNQSEREKATAEAKRDALRQAMMHKDGSGALLSNPGGIEIRGTLASLITVESGWQNAVAGALGSLADALVVSDLSGAVSALSYLKSERAGNADLLILGSNWTSGAQITIPAGAIALSSKVSSATLHEVLPFILNGFVAADSLHDAKEIVANNPQITAITRAGDVLSRARVRGGSALGNSMIEINEMIAKAESALESAGHHSDRLRFDIARAEDLVRGLQGEFDSALALLNESGARMAGFSEEIAAAGQGVKSALAEVERLSAAIEEASQSMGVDHRELLTAEEKFNAHEDAIEPDTAQVEELRSKVATYRALEIDARLSLRTSEERTGAISHRARDLENAAQAEREATTKSTTRRAARARGAITAQVIADAAHEGLIQIEASISRAGTERQRLESGRLERDGEILSLRSQIRELTSELELLTSSVHRDEIARAEQRMRLAALEARAVEEYGIDGDTLTSEYGPDKDVPTFYESETGEVLPGDLIPYRREQQERRLASAERQLALLGRINPLALEEFSSLEERLRYLAEQLEDLKKSRKDLLDIIKEVDERVQGIFLEAYKDTAREFAIVFQRLFPGGDGRLILTNPDDLVATGVEVEARPPGKRIKRLSLLSGGERSLTAVALLLAIFKARPSPFYILDEVEASLDDTNLGRLLTLFEELRADSQLIIITHQKRTMEIGDSLYGITMRGDGVSEVISQRLRESEVEPAQ